MLSSKRKREKKVKPLNHPELRQERKIFVTHPSQALTRTYRTNVVFHYDVGAKKRVFNDRKKKLMPLKSGFHRDNFYSWYL